MSSIFIDNEDKKQEEELINLIKTVNPETQNILKTIIWWEGLKKSAECEAAM